MIIAWLSLVQAIKNEHLKTEKLLSLIKKRYFKV